MTRSLALALAFCACASSEQTHAWETTAPPASTGGSDADHQKLVVEGDAAWAQRGDRAQLEKAIAAYEAATKMKSDDWQTWVKLDHAVYFLADAYLNPAVVEGADKAAYEAMHEKGIKYGEYAMISYSPEFKAKVQAGAKVEDAVELIGKDGIGTMYWYASNLGKWANSKGFTTRLAQKDKILKVMRRCLELDPDYFYAAPHRYFGAFYAIAPAFAGGDLDKSAEHFKTAISKQPNYFGTHYLYAENYATKKGDKDLFKKELDFILSTPESVIPELVPEQKVEKVKAKRLMDQINDKF